MTDGRTLRLHVLAVDAPSSAGEEFGLQSKSGELDEGIELPFGARQVATEVAVHGTRDDGPPDVRGDHVHGRPGHRFLYLGLRSRSGNRAWIRRIKVPLDSIGWSLIERAADEPLQASVDGRSAATVAVEWRVAEDADD